MKKIVIGVTGIALLAGSLYFLSPFDLSADTSVVGDTLRASGPIEALLKEDSAVTIAIAAYPDSVRNTILTVCEYPDAILRVEELQQKTQTDFRTITASLNKENQARIWNIARYKGLTEKLAGSRPLSKTELETLAASYPEDVRGDIVKSGSEDYLTLKQVVELNRSTEVSFDSLVDAYPADVQNELRKAVAYPELIQLLGGNMRLTVKAGDLHKTDHVKLHHQFDSLNLVIATEKAKEAEGWKNGLEKNPTAKSQFDSATTEYRKEHNTVNETTVVNETVVVNYVCYPYPYWYGYPYWYDYPYWYPYPYWYACGYYYGPYGIVYWGCPTPYYSWWYFYHYPHHYHYCYFSDYYCDYYYGHHHAYSPSGRVVQGWVAEEQPRVGQSFFVNDASRPGRFQELGRAEMDRAEYNAKNPAKQLTRDEFVRSNQAKYPDLVPTARQGSGTPGKTETPPRPNQPGAPGPTTRPGNQGPTPRPAPTPKVTPPSPRPTPAPVPPRTTPTPQPKPPVPNRKPK